MTETNWNNFKSKFNGKERGAFESLAYMLFCYEHDISIGIFRFKNQTGIETEPITVKGETVGFQAKYFDAKIDKNEIVVSMTKAKAKNPALTKILLYTNLELSESSSTGKKKSTLQNDIENAAENLSVAIEWRVPSHFEQQLSNPGNEYLAEYFFSLSKGTIEFLEKLKLHSENILGAIQTSIDFEEQEIKIDRHDSLSKIEDSNSQIIILAGDGGSGKTALIKDYIFNSTTPCYVLKAVEFARLSLNEVFYQFGPYDLADFLRFHEDEGRKIFVIDSAEKLADLSDVNVFIEFLTALMTDGWEIIFTTRNSYLDDLCFQMLAIYRRTFHIVKLENLVSEELQKLSTDFEFHLPTDSRLLKLICNLFYLKEYLANYRAINGRIDVVAFRDILWQRKIQNSQYRKDNTHIEREKCFLNLAKERSATGNFFLRGEQCDSRVLSLLETDEVIKYEPAQSGYFITHDIYEEWALEKLIENEFASLVSCNTFFANIGDSLPMRRAFRSWLSEKLFQEAPDVKHFIQQAFNSDLIPQFWKDELLISVLLSEYCSTFFAMLGSALLDNDKSLLKRTVFLLRTACKEVDNELQKVLRLTNESLSNPEYVFTKPKGKGWEVVISYLNTNVARFNKDELPIILPLLDDWVRHKRKGATTRIVGLFALHFYSDSELNNEVYYEKETEESLLQLVLFSAAELKSELIEITDRLLSAPSDERQPFESLRDAVLTDGDNSFTYIANMPELTIKMADRAWYEHEKRDPLYFSGTGVEEYYSIRRHWHHDYFPASAFQTPVYQLLMFSFRQTIDFILDFTNRTVESYYISGWDKSVHEIDVVIGERQTKQIISSGLWDMYRGGGSPVTPYLLQSIHMALEKRLLEIAKQPDKATIEGWLIYLLEHTCSASITAIVASVVLAHPDDLFNVAKILFSNYEFFKCDNQRLISEHQAKSIYSIGRGLNYQHKKFEDERLATCEEPHRKMSLENLALNYQFFKNEHVSDEQVEERQNAIWNIIDGFYATIPEGSNNDEHIILRLLLARIDRRKMNPTVEREEDRLLIHFNPELAPDLQEYSQQALKTYSNRQEYTKLKLWAVDKVENQSRYGPYQEYDDNTNLVIKETREVVEGLQSGDEAFRLFNSSIPAFACSALVKNYNSKLSKDDLSFCKDIIQAYATFPLQENYGYQIADGVEAAISAFPSLYPLFADEKHNFNLILLLILFDTYALGAYKRICDYAIEALSKLFDVSADDANAVLFGYMHLKPKFDKENPPGRWMRERKSRAKVLDEFISNHEGELTNISSDTAYYQSVDFGTQKLQIAETAFQIIPVDTSDERHLDYVSKVLQKFSSELLKTTRYNDRAETDYSLKHRFFKKFSSFLLHRDVDEVDSWARPFASALCETDETGNLLSEIVSAEDILVKYETFWKTWECFYPVIKAMARKSRGRDLNTIISNYLLAWPWWKETAKEWRSLREHEKVFFRKASVEMGQHPAVLYSLSKLLNEIGSSFLDEGILWIGDMLIAHKNLQAEELLPNTVYYLEKVARKYVYLNRTKLKSSRSIRDRVMALLDFLISKGSVNGYLLREDVY